MRYICIQKGGKCYFYLASGTCPLYKTEPQTFEVISFQITVNQNEFVYIKTLFIQLNYHKETANLGERHTFKWSTNV